MPSASSITVKKNDGTTDIVYDLLTASGGENSPFVVRQDTGAPSGLPVGLRPVLTVNSKWNGNKTARQLPVLFKYPYATQDTTTQLYKGAGDVVFSGMLTAPVSLPQSVIDEAVSQGFNLIASTLVKAMGKAGYAAT